jgi:tetratricopeptide (TPR) repeat protein
VTSRCGRLVLLALAFVTLARAGTAAAQSPAPRGGSGQPPHAAPADPAQMERQLSEAVRTDPGSFQAHHALAVFYLRQGRLNAAIPQLQRAYAIDSSQYVNSYDLALALLQTGRLDDARAIATQTLNAKDTAELHNLLGDIEERAGHLVAAAEQFQRAAHMDATEEHLFDWGNNLLQLRVFEEAIQVFTAAIARHPASARLNVGLGIAQYSRAKYNDAVTSFCRAVDLAPSDPRPYQFLGEIYGVAPELGSEVTQRLSRFVAAQPKNALAHLYYALSLWKGQRTESEPDVLRRVEALLRRAVTLDPKLARGFLELGILLSDEERYQEAIQPLRRATQLEPDLAQAHYRLSQVYRRTGQKALAETEIDVFEKLKAGR